MSVEEGLVDGLEDAGRQRLDDFVLQAADGERPSPSLRFGDEDFTAGPWAPSSAANGGVQGSKVVLQLHVVLLLRHTIDSAGSGTVELTECLPEIVDVEVVEQRTHLLIATTLGSCAYPVQLRVPAEWSVFADLRGETELAHSPCPPSLHRR